MPTECKQLATADIVKLLDAVVCSMWPSQRQSPCGSTQLLHVVPVSICWFSKTQLPSEKALSQNSFGFDVLFLMLVGCQSFVWW